jgi:hypothetical protein
MTMKRRTCQQALIIDTVALFIFSHAQHLFFSVYSNIFSIVKNIVSYKFYQSQSWHLTEVLYVYFLYLFYERWLLKP